MCDFCSDFSDEELVGVVGVKIVKNRVFDLNKVFSFLG